MSIPESRHLCVHVKARGQQLPPHQLVTLLSVTGLCLTWEFVSSLSWGQQVLDSSCLDPHSCTGVPNLFMHAAWTRILMPIQAAHYQQPVTLSPLVKRASGHANSRKWRIHLNRRGCIKKQIKNSLKQADGQTDTHTHIYAANISPVLKCIYFIFRN